MNLLRAERDTLEAYLPGLDKYLSEIPLLELERPGSGALARFRELGRSSPRSAGSWTPRELTSCPLLNG